MALKQWSLDRVWAWLGAAAVLVSFLPGGLYVTHLLSDSAERELVGRAQALVTTLAGQIIEMLLVEDTISLQDALQKAVASDEQVRYAAIEDSRGDVIAHTFTGGYPSSLIALWRQSPGPSVRYSAGSERMIDVSLPLFEGQLGRLHVGVSRTQAYEASNRALLLIGVAFLGGISIVVLGVQVICGAVSRPLGRLEMLVSQYPVACGENGKLAVGGTREVESLAGRFGEMIQRLKILEQERIATQKSMIYAERLAALGELASGLAHEIRNPLDGVQECVRYLQADPDKSEQATRYYPMMQQGLQRISMTIQEMLTFAKSGKDVSPAPCHTSEVFNELTLLVAPRTQNRQIEIQWQTAQDLVCLCDHHALVESGLNLILNAIDAVEDRPNPEIKVCAWCDSRWVHVSVEDNGPGVPPHLRDQIFAVFFSTKPPGKGTGLGLAVSRQLMQAVGGELTLSDEPGSLGGAKFLIKLPKFTKQGICHDTN